jgi:NADH-quinone oxidoreductase subunit I
MAYGTGIAKGMGLTLRQMFRAPATIQYPEETRPIPVYARTNLLWFEERCTGCSTCAQACPDGCILVATSQDAEGRRNIDRYEIDFRICMYCGLCTEACPYEAIQPGGTFRDAVYWFDDMYHDKYELTRLAHEHLQKNEYTYPNGLKAPRSVIDFIEAEARGEHVGPPAGTHAQIPSQPNGALLPGASGQPRQETIDRG